MTKSLFNEYEAFPSEDAQEISDRSYKFAKDLIQEFAAKGYSRREIGHIIAASVSVAESETVLRAALEKRRAKAVKP